MIERKYLKFLYIYTFISLLIILMSNTYLLELMGIFISDTNTVYPIFNYLTGHGRFDDFYVSLDLASGLPSPSSSYIISPLIIFLSRVSYGHALIGHIIFLMLSMGLWIYAAFRVGRSPFYVFAVIFSYPVIFAISRSNHEIIASGLLLNSFIQFNWKGESFKEQKIGNSNAIAIILFALSVSIKPITLVFMAVYPFKEIMKYWYIFFIIFFLNIFIIDITSADGIFKYFSAYFSALDNYKIEYMIGSGGTLFNNSLFGLIKIILINLKILNPVDYKIVLSQVLSTYGLLATVTVVFSMALCFTARNLSCKVGLLCGLVVLCPAVSADYRLLYILLYIIFIYYYNNEVNFFLLAIALLIILPKHIIYFQDYIYLGEAFTLQSTLQPLLLIIFVMCNLWKLLFSFSGVNGEKN